jgi:hypothetical protein
VTIIATLEGDSVRIWLSGGVQVGWGVSEATGAFGATLAAAFAHSTLKPSHFRRRLTMSFRGLPVAALLRIFIPV